MKGLGPIRRIKMARNRANEDIRAIGAGGPMARALAPEGYAGGYRDALSDVLLLLQSKVVPDTRGYWTEEKCDRPEHKR